MAYRRKSRTSYGSRRRVGTRGSGYSKRRTVSGARRSTRRPVARRRAPARRASTSRGQTIRIVVEHTSADQIARPDLVPAKAATAPRKAKH